MKVRSEELGVRSEELGVRSEELGVRSWLLMAILFLLIPIKLHAQEYSVASFRLLPNDVSAFIHPERDLNDEACALVKVECPVDFAFSSPLGIVKRKDEVGEVWLYLPKGTKTLTLKHPDWGVIRDYKLGKPLESRMTYEMKLLLPKPEVTELHDTIVQVKTVVDTVAVAMKRPKMPLAIYTLATIALHEDGPSYGLWFALMHRHGFFLHASTDLKSIGSTVGNCQEDGSINASGTKPYYTGSTKHSNYTLTLGAIHHLGHGICLFEGIGYGKTSTAWEQSQSEGGGYILNDGLSHKGMAAEVGVLASFGRFAVNASAITIAGKQWQGSIGIGIKIGKIKKK